MSPLSFQQEPLLMLDAGELATYTLLAGLILLGLELIIPSMGMLGVLSAISLLVSVWSAWKAWYVDHFAFFVVYLFVFMGGIPGTFFGVLSLLMKTRLGRRLILQAPPEESVNPPKAWQNELEALIGSCGTAENLMTPGGLVRIDGQRYHAESLVPLVERGTEVIAVRTKGSRLVVRPVTAEDRAKIEASRDPAPPSPRSEVNRSANEAELGAQDAGFPAPDSEATPPPSDIEDSAGELDFDIPEDYTGAETTDGNSR